MPMHGKPEQLSITIEEKYNLTATQTSTWKRKQQKRQQSAFGKVTD